jgi:hypothetical protein
MSNQLLERIAAGGEDSTRVEIRELAKLAGIDLAWRPWPRRWLTEREHRLIGEAVMNSGCELPGGQKIPRSLRSHVSLRINASTEPSHRRRWARITWTTAARIGGLAGFAAALATLLPLLLPTTQPPRQFSGELNFAIVPFEASEHTQQGRQDADILSQTFATSLRSALKRGDPGVDPDVRVLDGTSSTSPSPTDPTRESRLAAVLAARFGADAVIFGSVDEGSSTTVTPRVYVAPRRVLGASEFAGTYALGDPIRIPVPLASSAPATGIVRRTLTTRATGLALFIDAIGYLSLERFADAARYLRAAERSPGWQTADAKGLLELFLGNATAKLPLSTQTRLDRVEAFYRAALAQVSGFARARLGLAEVAFQRAHGDCTTRDADRNALERASAQFNSVLKLSSRLPQPEREVVATKAHFGLGRVYLCQSQAELAARWADAERELQIVASSYQRNELLRDDAAEALADLAIVALPGRGQRNRRDAYLEAQTDYSRAIKLSADPTAKPALYANRAFVESRLGNRVGAKADYERAARLQRNRH